MLQPYSCRFSHPGLPVTDLDAAVKFYTEVMDWYALTYSAGAYRQTVGRGACTAYRTRFCPTRSAHGAGTKAPNRSPCAWSW